MSITSYSLNIDMVITNQTVGATFIEESSPTPTPTPTGTGGTLIYLKTIEGWVPLFETN